MTLLPLHVCCSRLAIDPKTLRRWLSLARIVPQPDSLDARTRCLTPAQLSLLARHHARPLGAAPVDAPDPLPCPPPPPPAAPSCPPSPPWHAELTALHSRVTLLQEQVTQLTSALIRERDLRLQHLVGVTHPLSSVGASRPDAPGPVSPSPLASAAPLSPSEASASSPMALKPLPPHPHPPVIPLIEAREDGSVILICPQRGILPLTPDTPHWFEWLTSLPSFRFQGTQGRFGAQRKTIGGLPTREWRAYRHSQNHQHTFYLGMTENLTVARLEQMAATITARIAIL